MTSSTRLQNVFIFHGYAATPDDHWFGWLAEELGRANMRVVVPALPDSLTPDSSRWRKTIRSAVGGTDTSTVLIAHSLGCLAVLRHLASLTGAWRLGHLVLVSGFLDPLPTLPVLDEFIGVGCDVTGLRDQIDEITVIRSDDDSIVPPSYSDRLADLLGVKSVVVPGAGHFLADDGYNKLHAAYDAVIRRNR
ncbi:alpha/beta hydrolase [uncultured Kocuria sp.]|uniref:RBBP9/YdeN family alpha/beta hydrolase n=1 Tax=uncultured Kocuria sp. TaxID=259305 RepID=UPI0025989D1B|nr:alpha/beta hydrolase [uncultured Kocuria sp.]MCT1367233.1 alpha/beta hydrolase [Rothia sp. p3-SID1597]